MVRWANPMFPVGSRNPGSRDRTIMETLWFIIVALMITAYVVLDGFDLGAGSIFLFAEKTSVERRMVLRAIAPVWDGQ